MSQLDNVRVELSFDDPDTLAPTWRDFTSRALMRQGISITRGRTDELGTSPPGQATIAFKNDDGHLTPELGVGPYAVECMNRVRVSHRDPTIDGNLVPAESASFEGGTIGSWVAGGSVPPTPTNSAVRAWTSGGTRSMLVTWGAAGSFPNVGLTVSGLVAGRAYTFALYVWVPTGSPDVATVLAGGGFGSGVTTKDAWGRSTLTFTASTPSHTFQLWPLSTPSAGQQVWVDAVQLDEGSSARTFTLNPPPIMYRYDGFVEEWPLDWPGGGQTEAQSVVTAFDIKGRFNRAAALRSVIEETYALSTPTLHMPMNEADDNTVSVGDRTGTDANLARRLVGSGLPDPVEETPVLFGGGTGPATDGGRAVRFAPFNLTNGGILAGALPRQGSGAGTTGFTYTHTFRCNALSAQTMARWADPYNAYLDLGLDATGHVVLTFFDTWSGGVTSTYTTPNIYADNQTHVCHVTVEYGVGLGKVFTLYLDGTAIGGFTTDSWVYLADLGAGQLTIGGTTTGRLFTGTIAHVAAFEQALTAATILEHATGVLTGFAGERTDQRITRVASWVGIASAFLNLDVGNSLVSHVDSTGMNAGDYLDLLATTEAGSVFGGVDGRLTFHNRARTYAYAAPVDIAVPTETVDPSTGLTRSITGVINDVTVARLGGATVHLTDAASRLRNGESSTSLTVASSTDGDALSRAQWLINSRAWPTTRLPQLGLDGLTEPTSSPAVRGVDIDHRVSLGTMPLQAPGSITDLRVQGYREVISKDSGWEVTANTTPFLIIRPLVADDPVFGLADANNRAVY